MIKNPLLIIISIATLLLFYQCNSIEPPSGLTIRLKLEDVSSTEAWITLSSNLNLPATIELKQNSQVISTINLRKVDSLLYISSLLPNTHYTFQASNGSFRVTSNQLTVTTLDTTSHNFTWQSWTFGEHSSSRLNDVAIIAENNIWAVGEIYINDSLGQPDPQAYNTAHWDGIEWELKRVYFPTVCGSNSLTPYPANAIFTFENGQIWVSSSGDKIAILHNSIQLNQFCLPPNVSMSINKIWGTSGDDLYVVGDNGSIAHYNGTNWQKLESGTDVDIQDIWGVENNLSGEPLILCAASYVAQTGEKKILSITNVTQVDTIFWGTGRRVHSLWFNSSNKLFASGGGVFIRKYDDHWVEQTEIPLYFTERVRGKDKNDVFAVGHFGLIAHYSGSSWKTYPEASIALVYTSLDYKNNLMVTVGYTQNQAVVQFMMKN